MLEGVTAIFCGDALKHRTDVRAAALVDLPANMPHPPFPAGATPARTIIAQTDPHEQESMALLPGLAHLVPQTPVTGTPVRTTGRGAVRSFHWLSARFTAGRASRPTNCPCPSCVLTAPSSMATCPRVST